MERSLFNEKSAEFTIKLANSACVEWQISYSITVRNPALAHLYCFLCIRTIVQSPQYRVKPYFYAMPLERGFKACIDIASATGPPDLGDILFAAGVDK